MSSGISRRHYLVDHLPRSGSTHSAWWRHIAEGLGSLGEEVFWISKNLRHPSLLGGRPPSVFWYFTEGSIQPRLADVLTSADIVLTWQGLDDFKTITPNAFFVGYPGETVRTQYLIWGIQPDELLTFQPMAPLASFRFSLPGKWPQYDFTFFGTVWESNYDRVESILRPLSDQYSCKFRGLTYNTPRDVFRLGFSRRLVSERIGWRTLLEGKINLGISHVEHRRLRSVTERVFLSSALGRPFVADNLGARDFFEENEVIAVDDPSEYLDRCNFLHAHPSVAQEMAVRAYERTSREYTYRHSVAGLIEQLRAHL